MQGHWGASTSLGYAGQYTDAESGLQYLQARYYDPSAEQFLTVDPLVSQTMDPYSYTADDPFNAADPSGMCSSGASRDFPGSVRVRNYHDKHCQVYLRGMEKDARGWHYNFEVLGPKGGTQYNFPIYYRGESNGTYTWLIRYQLGDEWLDDPVSVDIPYGGTAEDRAEHAAFLAASYLIDKYGGYIEGYCQVAPNTIKKKLTQATSSSSGGILAAAFYNLWAKQEKKEQKSIP